MTASDAHGSDWTRCGRFCAYVRKGQPCSSGYHVACACVEKAP